MDINERLKILRKKELGVTQDDISAVLGLQRSSYCMIENGHRKLRDNHIKVISSHYNVNERWLRYGEEPVFNQNPYRTKFLSLFDEFELSVQKYFIKIMEDYLDMQKEDSHM